ncbi:MAG: hypothetical protein ACO1QR_07495, partial [Chthoniobacteraceae bacterium]
MAIRTVLIEDVTSFADALKRYIEVSDADVEWVAAYGSAEAALQSLQRIEDEDAVFVRRENEAE